RETPGDRGGASGGTVPRTAERTRPSTRSWKDLPAAPALARALYPRRVSTRGSRPLRLPGRAEPMHGNVHEGFADWYAKCPAGSAQDPSGPSSGTTRVMRGGRLDG